MLHPLLALVGIASVAVAVIPALRAFTVKKLASIARKGLLAIVIFSIAGFVLEAILPGILTQPFLTAVCSSLFVGVGFFAAVLALVLLARLFNSASNGDN
jgi:hypothetical protein